LIAKRKNWSQEEGVDDFITFLNLAFDKALSNMFESYLWRTAFFHKVITCGRLTTALVYEKGFWRAYTANVGDSTNDRLTMLTHKKYQNRYLMIRGNGVELKYYRETYGNN
jgi:hypothetical protein